MMLIFECEDHLTGEVIDQFDHQSQIAQLVEHLIKIQEAQL